MNEVGGLRLKRSHHNFENLPKGPLFKRTLSKPGTRSGCSREPKTLVF